jgi:PBP1b-binding outer membrane lipoprotein LpoB
MKKVLLMTATILVMSGCVSKPTKEMKQVRSISDTENCLFKSTEYLETAPFNTMNYIQKTVVKKGGDSYKMISSTPISILSNNDAVATNIEIYKCRSKSKVTN